MQYLDELKIINEDHYLESLFHYYEKSLFSLRKIKNKGYKKIAVEKIPNFGFGGLWRRPGRIALTGVASGLS